MIPQKMIPQKMIPQKMIPQRTTLPHRTLQILDVIITRTDLNYTWYNEIILINRS